MTYTYNGLVTIYENIREIQLYGQLNMESEEEEIRNHLAGQDLNEDEIEQLIIAYRSGLNQPK